MSDPKRYERLIRQAYKRIQELEAERDEIRRSAASEPIAVVGVGCRFPGAPNPEAYWRLLARGVDATTEAPANRNGFAGNGWRGGFLADLRGFDPLFFGISAREAQSLDPQQRLLLEVTWEALEHAGIAASSLLGSNTGVFIGIMSADYGHQLLRRDHEEYDAYQSTGTSASVASGRLAYTFGFQGPAITVDTACSSSLVSVHLAIQSLRRGECGLAIAGGSNILVSPHVFASYGQTTALSPDGRCKTFSARADGFGRGEGCGVVVLRRLADAQKSHDPILAVLRGSAVNQDGRVSGLTVPNGPAQQAVISAALQDADVGPTEVSFVEAHGTGTALGDPIEVGALNHVYGQGRSSPLWLGAVKSNFGHLEGSAGIAALLKAILSLQHQAIPPNLHCEPLSEHIPWAEMALRVPTTLQPWESLTPRLAGVSSFGISGTNAHVIVGEAPPPSPPTVAPRSIHVLPLSARSPEALDVLVGRYAAHLRDHPKQSLATLCATAALGRSHFEHRIVVRSSTSAQCLAALEDPSGPEIIRDHTLNRRLRVAFLFAGQGGQYPRMGYSLYREYPVFRAAIDRCDALLRADLELSLADLLYGDSSHNEPRLGQTKYTQPALFSLQYALSQLWQSWGIEPYALMGHSAGEYVAACLAGVFSLKDGLRLVVARGRLMHSLPPTGRMAAVIGPAEAVQTYLRPFAEHPVSIAAYNGPENTVLTGIDGAVRSTLATLEQAGFETKLLDISIGSHCPLMEPILPEFARIAQSVTYHPPKRRLISNLTGQVAGPEIARADYWVQHIRKPVRFSEGARALAELQIGAYLEVGPRAMLLSVTRPSVGEAGAQALWLASLRKGCEDTSLTLESLAHLYARGAEPNWRAIGATDRVCGQLPTYPFEREPYWIEASNESLQSLGSSPSIHPLLGRAAQSLALAPNARLFQAHPGRGRSRFLSEHRVLGQALMPGTGYLELALAVASQVLPDTECEVRDLVFKRGLRLSPPPNVQTLVEPCSAGYRLTVASFEQTADANPGLWVEHASAVIAAAEELPGTRSLQQIRLACPTQVGIEPFYAKLAKLGIEYGPSFRGLQKLWQGSQEALGLICLAAPTDGFLWHPGLLDAALQVSVAASENELTTPQLPTAIERVQLATQAPPGKLIVHANISSTTARGRVVDFAFYDEEGAPQGQILGLYLRNAGRDALAGTEPWRSWLYTPIWRAKPLPPSKPGPHAPKSSGQQPPTTPWMIVSGAPDCKISQTLATQLRAAKQETELVSTENLRARTFKRGTAIIYVPASTQGWPSTASQVREATKRCVAPLLELVKNLASLQEVPPIWLVTQRALCIGQTPLEPCENPAQTLLWGMARSLHEELPGLSIRRIDLDGQVAPETLANEFLYPDDEAEVGLRAHERFVPRLVPSSQMPRPDLQLPDAPNYRLEIPERGSLDNLVIVPHPAQPPGPGEVQLRIHATGLNFRDVLNALGEYPGDPGPLGNECSGEVVAVGPDVTGFAPGDRVCALAHGSFLRTLNIDHRLVAPIGSLGMAQAATIPITFLTSAYALFRLAEMQAGDRVLIHAASGGVGQAAIQLARRVGAEVYATASRAKWNVVRGLGVERVYDSRNLDFRDEILRDSEGQGVDIVLNSLTSEGFVESSLATLAKGGRFVELSKRNLREVEAIRKLRPDIAYWALDLGVVRTNHPQRLGQMLREVMADVEAGHLQPLPYSLYQLEQARSAFRTMQKGLHTGKLVITQQPPPGDPTIAAIALRADGSYLITGGLGGLGLVTAASMAARGAGHLILLGRSTPGPEATRELEALREVTRVTIASADVCSVEAMTQVLGTLPPKFPLRGVIHAAGILDDGVVLDQTWARFERVLAPKVIGGWVLDQVTRTCPLDFFVNFSSATAILGTAGQTNHAAANAFLDELARHRRAHGYPGQSINWGAWSEVGVAAGPKLAGILARKGMGMISPIQGVESMYETLHRGISQMAVLPVDWERFLARFAPGRQPQVFTEVTTQTHAGSASSTTPPEQILRARLAEPSADPAEACSDYVAARLSRLLGLRPEQLTTARPLNQFGLDSLMAVELRHHLRRDIGANVSLPSLLDDMTIERLVSQLVCHIGQEGHSSGEAAIDTWDEETF